MENITALMVILIVIALSKRNELPIIIALFYVIYIIADSSMYSALSGYHWHIVNAAIDVVILFMALMLLASGSAYVKTTFLYMLYVMLFYFIPDILMIIGMSIDRTSLVTEIYTTVMIYAIPIDIMFAIIGSDNKVSQLLFRGS